MRVEIKKKPTSKPLQIPKKTALLGSDNLKLNKVCQLLQFKITIKN
jgi:hypothetical protein